MFAALAIALMVGGGAFAFFAFMVWVGNEHRLANLYRNDQGTTRAPDTPTGPRFKVAYKLKGKRREVVVSGITEGEALHCFMKLGVAFDSIMDVKKVEG